MMMSTSETTAFKALTCQTQLHFHFLTLSTRSLSIVYGVAYTVCGHEDFIDFSMAMVRHDTSSKPSAAGSA